MFTSPLHRNRLASFFSMAEVTFHSIVRQARGGHRNAVIAMLLNMLQAMMLLLAFLVFFQILGLRGSPIRGDMLLFLMSGIFLYISHIRTVSAVMSAGDSISGMVLHRPMNTLISILSAALSALYLQFVTIIVVLTIYHCAFTPVHIHDPVGALGIFILAWFSGVAVGMMFLGLRPWFPRITALLKMIYIRINMIASGKMFVVNALPATMIAMFDWNPLFHIIDQMRGEVFLHYNPQFTSLSYPIYVSLTLIMIGLMAEFFARQNVSISWFAGR